jgi:PAT family beta-lactamase induction signal transducer AmpG
MKTSDIYRRRIDLVLMGSKRLRMISLVLFYLTQGFPLGLFNIAIPAWMASQGVGAGEIAAVVATSALPWSLKLANGFILDRYAYLPMGRRRAWIIGAQFALVLALIAGALLQPAAQDIAILSILGFIANAAVTFQDVGIDSLAVDIMPEEERAGASGIMCGAQFLGVGLTSASAGWLLSSYGIAACFAGVAIIPALVMVFAIVIREREGEKLLPWTSGTSHPHNLGLQVEAWWPLLKESGRAVLTPLSLLLLPLLFVRIMPKGSFEVFHPVMFQQRGGWTAAEFTGFMSSLALLGGVFGMLAGGYCVQRAGAQRMVAGVMLSGAACFIAMALVEPYWGDQRLLIGFAITMKVIDVLAMAALITLAMQMCSPAVAATQFTIYMAISNFGSPVGAALAAWTTGIGHPALLYGSLAVIWTAASVIALGVKFSAKATNAVGYQLSLAAD